MRVRAVTIKRRLLSGLFALCATTGVLAGEPVLLQPRIRPGEVFNLEMKIERERVRGGETTRARATTPVRLEVLEGDADSLVFGWTIGKTVVDADVDVEFALEPLLRATEGTRRELVFDREFNALGVRNLEEVASDVKAALDVLGQQLGEHHPQLEAIWEQVRQMLVDPQALQVMMMDRPGRYFLPFGWELVPGEARTVETQLPSPFGGDPLPATLTVQIEPVEPGATQYVFNWRQQIDEAAAREFVTGFLKKTAQAAGQTLPDELPDFQIRDEARFEIDRASGWATQGRIVRTTEALGDRQRDTVEFRMLPGERTP